MNSVRSRLSSRLLLLAICLVVSGALIVAAGRMWMAAYLAGTRNAADWMRAVQIEPGNAAYWNQLGLYEEWDFTHGDLRQAIQDFQRATQLNPRSAQFWTALAGAYEASGQIAQARVAFETAQAAHPVSPDVAWQFGSFLLRQGEPEEAAEQIRRALMSNPGLASSAVSQFWKAGVGFDELFNRVLPAKTQDYLAALTYFVSQQEYDAAIASWQKLAGLNRTVPLNDSLDLIDNLIALNRIRQAEQIWRQALHLAGITSLIDARGSLIFDGNFEQNPTDGGFGWRWVPTSGSTLDLVDDIAYGSSQSARITFDGTANSDFAGLHQYVAISPSQRYGFSAYMRTDSISTDSGPQFVIQSCANPVQQLAQTPAMTGTHPWTNVRATFTAGKNLECVDVILRRAPSQMFDNKISGTVWVDNVRLVPVPTSGSSRQ